MNCFLLPDFIEASRCASRSHSVRSFLCGCKGRWWNLPPVPMGEIHRFAHELLENSMTCSSFKMFKPSIFSCDIASGSPFSSSSSFLFFTPLLFDLFDESCKSQFLNLSPRCFNPNVFFSISSRLSNHFVSRKSSLPCSPGYRLAPRGALWHTTGWWLISP